MNQVLANQKIKLGIDFLSLTISSVFALGGIWILFVSFDDDDDDDEDGINSESFTDDSGEGVTEPYLDVGRSFLEAYKNLSPKQIEGLTFDTKELLTTQQKLIETLNNIGPTLKEGKNILDTFKNYFVEE